MFHAIAKELETALRAKHVPFAVYHEFGDEPAASTYVARERIVLVEPLDAKGDSYAPATSVHKNPRMPSGCVDAALIRIFAKSPKQGAVGHDHIDRARSIRTHVIIELEYLVRARKNVIEFGTMGAVALKDANGSSVWSGAVYEIEFTVNRGNEARTWEGDAPAEVTIGNTPPDVPITTTTFVSDEPGPAGTPPDDAEEV
jgi:hypothetical protein